MGLTPEQQAARKGKMTGSRIKPIAEKDEEGTMRLWREMTDQATEADIKYWEDISTSMPVLIGEATEQLHLDRFELQHSVHVERRGEVVIHRSNSNFACTLDGFVTHAASPYVVECKHVGGREHVATTIRERYFPQCQWNMAVTGVNKCALSVIVGLDEPIQEWIERDSEYIANLEERAHFFLAHVRRRIPPYPMPEPLKVPPRTGDIDMMQTPKANLWGDLAETWTQTRHHAKQFEDCVEQLKKLVPADAKRAHGAGIEIVVARGARAAKTIKPLKEAA